MESFCKCTISVTLQWHPNTWVLIFLFDSGNLCNKTTAFLASFMVIFSYYCASCSLVSSPEISKIMPECSGTHFCSLLVNYKWRKRLYVIKVHLFQSRRMLWGILLVASDNETLFLFLHTHFLCINSHPNSLFIAFAQKRDKRM